MNEIGNVLLRTELDRVSYPDLRERIAAAEAAGTPTEPRSYPGYPRWPLDRVRPRRLVALDRTLAARRSVRTLGRETPTRRVLSRLLQCAHGITGDHQRGPAPSAGGLQAVELYLVHLADSWLPAGLFHYDRVGHHLSRIADRADRAIWREHIPVLELIEGGSLLWVLAGDGVRMADKYGARGGRFLLLEAGHVMQNLCLLSTSLGLCTVPLGGCFERPIARAFSLMETDVVLYVGVCGTAV